MVQIANRDDNNRAAENAKDAGNKTVDLAQNMASRTAETAKNVSERAAETTKANVDRFAGAAREVAGRSAETAQRAFDASARGAKSVLNAENDIARLWMETASEQLRHNVETMQRLASVRDWREAAEIHGEFVRESLSRAAHVVTTQLELGNAMTKRLLSFGRENLRKAA
jgi:gas vesicle protein